MQSLQNAGRQRCSPLQRGRAWPRGSGSQAETAGIVVCPEMEGLCVFEPVVAEVGFHYFVEQQFTLESCASKTQEEVRVLSSPGH